MGFDEVFVFEDTSINRTLSNATVVYLTTSEMRAPHFYLQVCPNGVRIREVPLYLYTHAYYVVGVLVKYATNIFVISCIFSCISYHATVT